MKMSTKSGDISIEEDLYEVKSNHSKIGYPASAYEIVDIVVSLIEDSFNEMKKLYNMKHKSLLSEFTDEKSHGKFLNISNISKLGKLLQDQFEVKDTLKKREQDKLNFHIKNLEMDIIDKTYTSLFLKFGCIDPTIVKDDLSIDLEKYKKYIVKANLQWYLDINPVKMIVIGSIFTNKVAFLSTEDIDSLVDALSNMQIQYPTFGASKNASTRSDASIKLPAKF